MSTGRHFSALLSVIYSLFLNLCLSFLSKPEREGVFISWHMVCKTASV